MESAILAECLLTFMFLMIILGATDKRAPAGFAPIAIGLGLTLIHLIGIPVTNLSVNPARSTGPAVIVGGWALGQSLAILGDADHWGGHRGLGVSLARRGGSAAKQSRARVSGWGRLVAWIASG